MIFSHVLYQLSYLGIAANERRGRGAERVRRVGQGRL